MERPTPLVAPHAPAVAPHAPPARPKAFERPTPPALHSEVTHPLPSAVHVAPAAAHPPGDKPHDSLKKDDKNPQP
jgi:hypothetical protein